MVTGGCYAEDTNPPITPGGILEVGMFQEVMEEN